MLRMEIALFLVVAFVAYMYFTAEKEHTALHKTFSVLLVAVLVHLALDGCTVYTVNHLDTVPMLLNGALHRLFLGSMAAVIYLFYQYIAILVREETGRPRRLDWPAKAFLVLAELGNFLLPISYTVTAEGNYSAGAYMLIPYAAVAFYLLLCAGLLVGSWKAIPGKKRSAIGAALVIEFTVCVLQGLHHTWLISGMGITLMTLSFYLTLENPEALRAELVEQKLSMLYLKSQVNPHFLYNTLDTIRIQAQLNGDKTVASLLMRLVDFFRHQSAGETTHQEERPIHGITRYLQEHLAEEVSLSVLAEEFHLNPQYISQLFKSEIGVNFLTYFTNIRMEQAKKLLLTTSLPIAEVSEQSGYADYRVFTKVFKKSEGVTPSQYRRDFLEQNG